MSHQPTNILFILADDLGYWGLGCYGNKEVQTPHLDRLAKRGMRFDNAFCVSPVCSPARASLLTGRIPSQHGIHDWIRRGNSPSESKDGAVIEYLEDQPAYTEALSRKGYRCGLSGKWHLGNAPQPQKSHDFWKVHARGGGNYYNAPVIEDGREVEEPRYVTEAITEHALDFLQQQAKNQPFYLGVHYTAPHSPWARDQHPEDYYAPYFDNCAFDSVPIEPMHPWQINTAPQGTTPEKRREILSGYYAATTAMDVGIGQLIDQLEAMGIAEDTLIVFTSDNGMNMGHHGIYGKGNGTYPQNMYDTSVKIPFILSCPSRIPEDMTTQELFSHYDFFPSLLGLLDMNDELPKGLPGKDLSELWKKGTCGKRESVVVFDEYGPVRMLRDLNYKLVLRYPEGPNEFYDLQTDPGERSNLYHNPDFNKRIQSYEAQLEAWFTNYVVPKNDGRTLPVKGVGQLGRCGEPSAFEQSYTYERS